MVLPWPWLCSRLHGRFCSCLILQSTVTPKKSRGGVPPSARVVCVPACECACACVCVCVRACVCVCACVYASACVCACANAMCLCACTYACMCLHVCVRVSVCAFPSYLHCVPMNLTSATASLSQRRGFVHVCLGLEHFVYIP